MNDQILSDENCDTLNELFNIGMGRAAKSLSEMVNEEVLLSVPSLQALSYQGALKLFDGIADEPINAVEQYFDGQFNGNAMLFYTQRSSQELVRRIIGDLAPNENFGEMEQEALKEVSNIILNACFGCLAEVLNCELQSGVPSIANGDVSSIFRKQRDNLGETPLVLSLSMTFSLPNKSIEGQVSLIMTSESIKKLVRELERFSSLYAM